jgi:hypothetical protein
MLHINTKRLAKLLWTYFKTYLTFVIFSLIIRETGSLLRDVLPNAFETAEIIIRYAFLPLND